MFATDTPLGRLAPLWAVIPRERRAGITSIFLRLRPTWNVVTLLEGLKSLEERNIMFLRSLKRIDVHITEAGKPSPFHLGITPLLKPPRRDGVTASAV